MSPVHNVHMAKPPHFLREWRKKNDKTLVEVAEHLGMSHGNLSKIERGQVPYDQRQLESLAELYRCDPEDLIAHNPAEPIGMWSMWRDATPDERRKIASVARTIMGRGAPSE